MKKIILLLVICSVFLASCTVKNNNNQMPNPASEFCEKNKGTLEIVTAADGSQSGICTLPDGTKCDEWAYFRSECPTGSHSNVEKACATDNDCACGKSTLKNDCFYGNNKYVNTEEQCPDFCTGIAGNLKIVCEENYCVQKKCDECPLLSQPSPDFCKYGKIVASGKDACGCQMPPACEPVACTLDAKACPGGHFVGRIAPNCEFAPCPTNTTYYVAEKSNTSCIKDSECTTPDSYQIMSSCPFSSICYFGKCAVVCPWPHSLINDTSVKEIRYYCTPEQKAAEKCTKENIPVCGWFNNDIKCLKYPCANTYGNKCMACADGKVEFYTEGSCPT